MSERGSTKERHFKELVQLYGFEWRELQHTEDLTWKVPIIFGILNAGLISLIGIAREFAIIWGLLGFSSVVLSELKGEMKIGDSNLLFSYSVPEESCSLRVFSVLI